jgi:hypothetical protein
MADGDGFLVDDGVITGVADMLRRGSDGLEKVGGSVPEAPDAGEVSGVMGVLMSKLVDAAGEVSTGAAAAAAAVEEGGRAYVETDQAATRSLPHVR